MIKKIIIYKTTDLVYLFAYNEKLVLEYFLTENITPLVEGVFAAKITKINKKSNLAFINYMDDKFGVINLNKNNSSFQPGNSILCQMTWAGDRDKQAKFTEEIKLSGKFVILICNTVEQVEDKHNSNQQQAHGSRKHFFASGLKNRARLNHLSQKYSNYGLIFRSACDNLTDLSYVEDEIQILLEKQQLIHLKKSSWRPAKQIIPGVNLYISFLKNIVVADDMNILVNDQQIFDNLHELVNLWQIPELTMNTDLALDDNIDMINLIKNPLLIDTQIEYPIITDNAKIVIHKLSGINLIDINSQNLNLSFYKVNYLAIDEIVRQIKLRDLVGIILIDFIKNMRFDEASALIQKLETNLADDWRKSRVLGFTNAGICEIIRNK